MRMREVSMSIGSYIARLKSTMINATF